MFQLGNLGHSAGPCRWQDQITNRQTSTTLVVSKDSTRLSHSHVIFYEADLCASEPNSFASSKG
jgi:hypothetical protein